MSAHKEREITIGPKSKVEMTTLVAIVGTAFMVGMFWADMHHQMQAFVTKDQMQSWTDDLREKNPTMAIPRLPARSGVRIDKQVASALNP